MNEYITGLGIGGRSKVLTTEAEDALIAAHEAVTGHNGPQLQADRERSA